MDHRLSLDGQRAIVTGAGRGIGRAHALELAQRGVAVLVNDVDAANADAVVAEIQAAGGVAVASHEPVGSKASGEALVAQAGQELGGLEIVINNAGFLRPDYFENLSEAKIEAVLEVHLMGALYVTQAAWPILQAQKYGRVVMTSSSSGMLGHQGSSNYSTAKAGIFGLMKALSYEGEAHNIRVNAILPFALGLMQQGNPIPDMPENYGKFLTPQMRAALDGARRSPEMIAHLAAFLVSRDCDVSGEAFSVCYGRFARVFVGVSDGWLAGPGEQVSGETVRDHLPQIRDISRHSTPKWLFEEVADVARRL